ncbi:hypothetical protein FPOA_02156 [Fusarium poae]|uniref:DUF6546 domain-containing protein n=1 Tax=Fusarium poae TaxID=36050 RepID=A0A1B8B672_FUSPO|nr:hypothetical protein FPOA_02156 [Fusarium poae]
MRLRSSGFLKWSSLPTEIRHLILNTIADLKNPRWAELASVSKEWQSVIGARNMAKLKLQSLSCFDRFRNVVRQRHLDRSDRLRGIDSVVSYAIADVLTVLSTWDTQGPLTLELNATSGSDTEHWAKNFRFDDSHDASSQDLTLVEPDWHDPKHGWVDGVQVNPPSFFALQQVFGVVEMHYGSPSPVTAVTSLMIRRQFRRCLLPSSLSRLLSQLVCLTEMIYEPWEHEYTNLVPWGYFEAKSKQLGFMGMPLPDTLKRLIVFRHSDEHITQSINADTMYQLYLSTRRRYREIDSTSNNSQNLAQTSLRLEQLSISFLIDAEDFLAACREEWTWDHLQSLALTFQGSGKRHEKSINSLLLSTAKLAMRMPKLETTVLWSGGRGSSCAFIYTRRKYYARVVWRGTWDLKISMDVLEAWQDVAKIHSLELRVGHERIKELINNYGDAIYHLNLPCKVVEPTSLWQMRIEGAWRHGQEG